jgi:tetratricopeptide (TPR) repeat protein
MAVEDAREQGSEQALSSSLTNLGIAYARQNKWEQAESSFKEALSIKEKAFGKSSTSVATTLQHYASMLREARRTDEALPLETRIRQILSGKPEQIITTTTKSTTITSVEQGGKSGTSKTSQTVNTSKVSIESNIEATQTTSEPLISKKERLSNEADKIGNILQKKAKAADNANDKIDLTTKEYEQILNSADAIMASIPHSHQAREILAASKQQGLAYRKKLELFMNEGGSDPKSIKTKLELDSRIKQVQDLSSSFKAYQKACASFLANSTSPQAQKNTQIMDMESKLLDEFSFQLKFLAENWGKWSWDPENRLQMWLPKVKIALYNTSVDKVRNLSGTQQAAIKESTNHTLQNLENIKKKL